MVEFKRVDPKEVPNFRESHRGRVSYPILKAFMETEMPLAALDRTGIQQSMQSLTSSLTAYIRNHNMPIKMFQRSGELYLARLDMDADGNSIPWSPDGAEAAALQREDIQPLNPTEVASRYEEEKGQTTK